MRDAAEFSELPHTAVTNPVTQSFAIQKAFLAKMHCGHFNSQTQWPRLYSIA